MRLRQWPYLSPQTVGASVTSCILPLFTCSANTSRISCSEKRRSEEHTSELQSLMRISYAVFCLKKKNIHVSPHLPYSTLPPNQTTTRHSHPHAQLNL